MKTRTIEEHKLIEFINNMTEDQINRVWGDMDIYYKKEYIKEQLVFNKSHASNCDIANTMNIEMLKELLK